MNIAFLGLGIMGSRMAANLLKNKVDLTVFNRSEAPRKELEAKGAKVAGSFTSAVKGADIVFTMLSTPKVVEEIMFGEKGCLASMKKEALWVDFSTVDPAFSKQSEQEAAKRNVRFADTPVAGTKKPAEEGSLVFFVGADKRNFKEIEILLPFMGSKIIHVGETGKGTSLKMLVNAMLAESMLIFSETLLLGEKMGFSKDFLLDTLPNLPVIAPFTKAKAELIRNNNFDVQFPLEWMEKDLRLVLKTASKNNHEMPITGLTKELFGQANASGLGRNDFSAIYKFLNEKK
ncbi:MAG TPA: NAD(P)-dependent oxidoreductase [Draconibacterium sp.]|nr:NAD(P)-dependent oxidoreductase [Draconibacterium sp.]